MADPATDVAAVFVLQEIWKKTKFQNKKESEFVLNEIQKRLPLIVKTDSEGIALNTRFASLANTITSQKNFQDMTKIAWRMAKSKSGQPQYKLSLLIVAMAAMITHLREKHFENCESWFSGVFAWLGHQLTIGGKGVTGDGEGNVIERLNSFFQTPYLHDFD